ncbi:uncharacterized mitochondrial protein-like protein [Tanacetum coccineum]
MILNISSWCRLKWSSYLATIVEEDALQGTKMNEELYGLAVLVFNQGDDPIACLNKAVAFMTAVAFSSRVTGQQVQGKQGQSYARTGYKGNATSSGGNNTGGWARVVKCYNCQGEGHMARQCTQLKRPRNAAWFKEKATTIPNTATFQTEDLDAYDFDCDDISIAKAVLMANISNYGSNVISEAAVQDTNLYAQQDLMILSVIKQMSEQMINHVNNWEMSNQEKNNESLTAELERYKELVKTFEQSSPVLRWKRDINFGRNFGRRFVPQQELSNEQAFWLQTSHPNTDQSASSPIKIEAHRELPKVSLVNTSLKKLKYHLGQFDTIKKKRNTPDALTEGE